MSAAGSAGGAAAAAAIIQAIKASGVIVKIEPLEFNRLLQSGRDLLVVSAEGGFFTSKRRYLTSYKGLAFYTETVSELSFPDGVEHIQAKKIWVPG